jgi:hypothetical protein
MRQNLVRVGVCGTGYSPDSRQEAEREREREREREMKNPRISYNLQSQDLSDLLLPARLHLLQFPPPHKTVPQARDQAFNT